MNKSYISYMANDRDIKGVLVNNYKLRKLGSVTKHKCLVTKLVSKNIIDTLIKNKIEPINIDFYNIMSNFGICKEKIDFLFDQYYFGKLFIFLINDDKMVYLDTDLLILKNIDHLFDKIHEYKNNIVMTYDTLMRRVKGDNDSYIYGEIIKTTNKFSSGVMGFKYNKELFYTICNLIKNSSMKVIQSWNGDQGIFNELFKRKYINVTIMDYRYNAVSAVLDYYVNSGEVLQENLHIIHFGLTPKPWLDVHKRTIHGEIEKIYTLEWLNTYKNFVNESLKIAPIRYVSINYESI